MQKILAIAIALSMSAVLIPGATAAETVDSEYFTTAGVDLVGFYAALSWRPCPDTGDGIGCDGNKAVCLNLDEDDSNGYETCAPGAVTGDNNLLYVPDAVKMGGGPLFAAGKYDSVSVRVNDDFWGTGAAYSACFMHPDGDNVCQTGEGTADGLEDSATDNVCGGPANIVGSPYLSSNATVFVFTFMVLEDLTACGGVGGTMHGDFYMK